MPVWLHAGSSVGLVKQVPLHVKNITQNQRQDKLLLHLSYKCGFWDVAVKVGCPEFTSLVH